MTAHTLTTSMSAAEFSEWMALWRVRAKEAKRAAAKAETERRLKGRR
jgi:hypothetical protein